MIQESLKLKVSNFIEMITIDIIYRILNFFLGAFLFTNLLPKFLFLIYMRENNFFSYDFFSNGLFGLNTFFSYIVISWIVLAFFISSGFFFINRDFINLQHKKVLLPDIFLTTSTVLLNIGIFYIILFKDTDADIREYYHFTLLICAAIALHFSNIIYATAKWTFYSALITFLIVIFGLLNDQKSTSNYVQFALAQFGSGKAYIEVKNIENNNTIAKGQLLLLSPENVFIKNMDTNTSIIVKRENVVLNISD